VEMREVSPLGGLLSRDERSTRDAGRLVRRNQLEHAIRTACQIIDHAEVIVVGSRAILGTYTKDELPEAATMSVEVDILPTAENDEETNRLRIRSKESPASSRRSSSSTASASTGVDLDSAALPEVWRDRLE